MENDKLERSGILGVTSMHAGALAGAVVVTGKKIGLCVKSIMTAEQGQAEQIKKSPVQVQAKKKKSETKKKKTKAKKTKDKKTKIKKKTKRPKRTSRPRNRPTSKVKAKISNEKSPERNASTDSVP